PAGGWSDSPAGNWNSPRPTCRAADRSRGCPSSDCRLRPVDGEDVSHGNRKNRRRHRWRGRGRRHPRIKRQPITWRPNANVPANPIPVQNYGNQAGGGTVHYGAVSWRLHEDDFRARSHTIARYGASAVPEHSSLADWPLSYADLEPYYDRAEYEL